MKLSQRQRTALEKSIKKWELIVDGKEKDKGRNNCELCKKYGKTCERCPVFLLTGWPDCLKTPHADWHAYHVDKKSPDGKVFDQHSRTLAQSELDFLRSILAEAT